VIISTRKFVIGSRFNRARSANPISDAVLATNGTPPILLGAVCKSHRDIRMSSAGLSWGFEAGQSRRAHSDFVTISAVFTPLSKT
jgi:hypothetical protein